MKTWACFLLLAAASLNAQQQTDASNPPSQMIPTGRVTGHVNCSDTGKPARFASIQLMSEQSAAVPLIDPAQRAAITGPNADKSSSKSNVALGSLLSKAMSSIMKGSSLSTMTALDGSYTLDKIPAGTYYVIPQLPGYLSPISQISQAQRMAADKATLQAVESAAQKVVIQPGSAVNLDIQLDRGAVIGGTVRYDDGSQAPGVTPILMLLDRDGKWKELPAPSLLPAVTDDQGHYRFSGLPAGKYAVKAALPTTSTSMGIGARSLSLHMNLGDALVVYSGNALWIKDVKPIELTAGESRDDVDIVFPVDGLHVISGSVVAKSDGHSINSGVVELEDPSDKTIKLRVTMVGKDGGFQFNYVPDGMYRLQVTSAADMEGAEDIDSSNPLAMLLNSNSVKSVKEFGGTGLTLTLPGNSEGLILQVPNKGE